VRRGRQASVRSDQLKAWVRRPRARSRAH
jgi:hypothetical protein